MMYVPAVFAETDRATLYAFMRRHSFATLIAAGTPEPEITHLPLLVDESRGVLRGHVARANPQWRRFQAREPLTAVFHGAHHYISPSWYQQHPSVPTWNYAVVHASGPSRLVEQRAHIEDFLRELVREHETGLETPWSMALPPDYLDTMIAAIVCFEIEISRLIGKFKLSQNRPSTDLPGIIAALERLGGDDARDIARMMRRPGRPDKSRADL